MSHHFLNWNIDKTIKKQCEFCSCSTFFHFLTSPETALTRRRPEFCSIIINNHFHSMYPRFTSRCLAITYKLIIINLLISVLLVLSSSYKVLVFVPHQSGYAGEASVLSILFVGPTLSLFHAVLTALRFSNFSPAIIPRETVYIPATNQFSGHVK